MTGRAGLLPALALLAAAGIGAWGLAGTRVPGGGSGEAGESPAAVLPPFSGAPAPSPTPTGTPEEGPLLRGVVVDGAGAPIPGAEVAASVDGNPRPLRTVSGPDGRFALPGFAAGDGLLVGARAPGFAPSMAGGARAGGEEVRIVLLPPARLAGRVRSSAAEPRPGARVRILLRFPGVAKPLGGMEVRADEEGNFLFEGLPAVPGTAEAAWKEAASGPVEFDLREAGGGSGLDLVVDEGPAISGRVVDAGGNPVEGIRVRARRADGTTAVARTREDGTFTLPGLAAEAYRVTVWDVLLQYEDPPPVEGVVPPRSGLEFVVTGRADAPGWFRFRCADPDGRTLLDVGTEGRRLDGGDSSRTEWAAGADGTFRSGNLRPGRYAYTFRSPLGTAAEEFTISQGETTDLGTVRLSPAAALRFRVVDPLGRPVDGVLALAGETGHPERGLDGEPSRFHVHGLPPGGGAVRLLHRAFEGRELRWAAGPGETADLGDVVLDPASGTLRGIVRSAAAGPVATVEVKLVLRGATGRDETELHAVTGTDGRFRLEGVAGGTWGTAVLLPPRADERDREGRRILKSYRAGPDMVLEPGGEAEVEIAW